MSNRPTYSRQILLLRLSFDNLLQASFPIRDVVDDAVYDAWIVTEPEQGGRPEERLDGRGLAARTADAYIGKAAVVNGEAYD